jgi:hypothetical protein
MDIRRNWIEILKVIAEASTEERSLAHQNLYRRSKIIFGRPFRGLTMDQTHIVAVGADKQVASA